jgi:hypothetical protein
MSRSVTLVITIIGLLVIAGLGIAYEFDRIGAGNLVFLGGLTVALGVVAEVFLRRLSHPDISLEQMLYKTDHPTRT